MIEARNGKMKLTKWGKAVLIGWLIINEAADLLFRCGADLYWPF